MYVWGGGGGVEIHFYSSAPLIDQRGIVIIRGGNDMCVGHHLRRLQD